MRNPAFYLVNPRQAGLLGPGAAGALGRPEAPLAAPATAHEGRRQQALAAGPEVMAARPRQRDLRYLPVERHDARILFNTCTKAARRVSIYATRCGATQVSDVQAAVRLLRSSVIIGSYK